MPQKCVSKSLCLKNLNFTCLAPAISATFYAVLQKSGAKSTCKAGKNRTFLKSADPPYSQSFWSFFETTPETPRVLCLKTKICGAELLHPKLLGKANQPLFKVSLLTRASPQIKKCTLFIRRMLQAISTFLKCYLPTPR